MLVHMDFDVCEQLRRVLDLVDKHRRFMQLQEHFGVGLGQFTHVQVVQ